MNKAFVREPEPGTEERCPICGSNGSAVTEETLREHLRPDAIQLIAASGYVCLFPACDVVYFDQFGRTVGREQVRRPVYPKDRDAPICGCFGLTEDDIAQDIREGVVTRTKSVVLRARTEEARCAVLAADGQCCVPLVQRCYMRMKQEADGRP